MVQKSQKISGQYTYYTTMIWWALLCHQRLMSCDFTPIFIDIINGIIVIYIRLSSFFFPLMDEFLREFSGRRKVPNCWKWQKISDNWPDRWIISYDYTILLWRIILHMCQWQKILKTFKTTFNGIFLQNWTIFEEKHFLNFMNTLSVCITEMSVHCVKCRITTLKNKRNTDEIVNLEISLAHFMEATC